MHRWALFLVVCALAVVGLAPALAEPPPWAHTAGKPTTTTVSGQTTTTRKPPKATTTTTAVPTTTTVAPTTTTTEPMPTTTTVILGGCTGVAATPATFNQTLINANPGATFCLADGLYQTGGLTLSSGQTVHGSRQAVFDGTVPVTNWTGGPSVWQSTGQSFNPVVITPDATHRECEAHPENCHYADLLRDRQRLIRVLNTTTPGPGQWSWDYATDTVYVGSDPTTAEMRLTNQSTLFTGNGYTLRGVTVQWYGYQAVVEGSNQTLQGVAFLDNHGLGAKLGTNGKIIGNSYFARNGQYGFVLGAGSGILVEDTEVTQSNYLRFANSQGGYWDAGACKAVLTDGLIVRRVFSHHNFSDGFWTDIDNQNSLVEDSRFEDNERYGYFHEISWAIELRNNKLLRNAQGGLFVGTASDVWFHNNEVYGPRGVFLREDDRGSGTLGVYATADAIITANTITHRTEVPPGSAGSVMGFGGQDRVLNQNNVFSVNTYLAPTTTGSYWQGGPAAGSIVARTFAQWQADGQDAGSTLNVG